MSPSNLAQWFDVQLKLLRQERESEKVEFDLLTSDKVKQGQTKLLERMGISIGGLGVQATSIGLGGKTIVELERPAQYHTDPKIPYHTFRPGLPAGILDHDLGKSSKSINKTSKSEKISIIEGVVSKVSDTSISLFLSSKEDENPPELPARCRIIKLADTGTFDRLEQTIENLRTGCEDAGICQISDNPSGKDKVDTSGQTDSTTSTSSKKTDRHSRVSLTPVMRILLGADSTESIDIASIPTPECASVLNDSQKYALRHALSPSPITLVFGPPGTGKTHTLVSIISAMYARGDRILIAAASNLAVDNIAERLLAIKLPLTRLGHPARVLNSLSQSTLDHQCNTFDGSEIIRDLKVEINANLTKLSAQGKEKLRGKARSTVYMDIKDLRKDYRQRERKHTQGIIKQARIVCATTHGAGSRQLENEVFDVVIIDESTQAFEAACWIPISKSKHKVILAGDPRQLPPTIKSIKHASTSQTKAKKTAPGKALPKVKEIVKGKKGNLVAGKAFKAKDDDSKSKETNSNDAEKTEGGSKDDWTETQPTQSTSDGESEDKSDSDGSQTEKETESTEKFTTPSGLGRKPSTQAKWGGPQFFKMKPPKSLEVTMFDRLLKSNSSISCLLDVQYRMHKMIMEFPSNQLYKGKLKAAEFVAAHLLKDLPNVSPSDSDGIADPVLFIDTAGTHMYDRIAEEGGDGSVMNENEAGIVVKQVKAFVDAGLLPEQIMVLSPYSAQVALLSSLLKPVYPTLALGSIDSCQGRENEAVILSLCRSNTEGVVGFLHETRRLNVAMTRAKRNLTVIGDSETLSKGGDFLKKWMDWLENNAEVRMADA